jgi:hypothetical protein
MHKTPWSLAKQGFMAFFFSAFLGFFPVPSVRGRGQRRLFGDAHPGESLAGDNLCIDTGKKREYKT